MPDPHRIRSELTEALSRPEFTALFQHKRRFQGARDGPWTPEAIACDATKRVVEGKAMVNPVYVEVVRGPVEFYRGHDANAQGGVRGGQRTSSAGTLGGYWMSRAVLEQMWLASSRASGDARRDLLVSFLRAGNFVLPEWNDLTHLACMQVPAGNLVVVVRGRGDWQAMRTAPGAVRRGGRQPIHSVHDVIREGMMPTPGVEQLLIPLFNDLWVRPVPRKLARWPFVR